MNDQVLITDRRYSQTVNFWRERLSRVVGTFHLPSGSGDLSGYERETVSVHLTHESAAALKRIGDGELGEFAVVAAGIAYLLSRYSGEPCVVVRTPSLAAGQTGSVGALVPLIVEFLEDETAAEYLSRVAHTIEESYADPSFPLHALIRDQAHLEPDRLSTVTLVDSRVHGDWDTTNSSDIHFQLRLDRGEIEIRYSSQACYVATQCLARRLATLLSDLEQFDCPLRSVPADTIEDRRLIAAVNCTVTPLPFQRTVIRMFEDQAVRTPEASALVYEGVTTTYAELDRKANLLAGLLRARYGILPESMVGIMLDRSDLSVIAILGVLKAGGAFVPIDTSYPIERVNYILNDTSLPLLITESDHLAQWLDFSGDVLALDLELPRLDRETAPLPDGADPQSLAYVIYTSGSTGQPKGCMVEHASLANYVTWASGYYFEDDTCGNFGLYSSLCFDFTLTNIFLPLVRGKTLRIYPQSHTIETILVHAFQAVSGVDTLKLTPSHIRLLEYMEVVNGGIRKVIAGGEELTPRHVAILHAIDPSITIYNEYGPTEATVGCIVKKISPGSETITVGRPIANTRVYILDAAGRIAPLGARGEICVAGAGLARGYHLRPDITAAKFFASPETGEERIYRTGDIGRWLPNGDVQCFRRLDDQVKIRGYRVELGEIENVLVTHENISAAAVVLREDLQGNRKLAAYLTGVNHLTSADLRAWLATRLPEHMIPADFLFLRELPLSPNGKVDRSALPAPAAVLQPANSRPTTAVEAQLLSIWQEIFATERISITDRYFDLGGDSLLAVQLISRIWANFAVQVSIDDIFDLQTVEAVAGIIEVRVPAVPEQAVSIPRIPRTTELPLSPGQQRLWFLTQLEGPNSAYNLATAVRLDGELNLATLDWAISEIVRRHEVLRTTYPDVGGHPVQSIASPAALTLKPIDVPSEKEALRLAALEVQRPFDLSIGPLYRISLFRLNEESYILLLVMHHIVSDAWSSGVLLRELSALYPKPGVPLPELSIQYADYAAWQHARLDSDAARESLHSLKRILSDAPEVLELPLDRPRPAIQTFRGDAVAFHVERELMERLEAISNQSGVTMFMLLLAAYAVFLWRYSGQEEVVIGAPVANRSTPETEALIGFFVNTLALRVDLSGNPRFGDLEQAVRRIALEALSHQEIPFEQVVGALDLDRDLSRTPLFQCMFAYEIARPAPEFPGLTLVPLPVAAGVSKFDLTLYMEQSASGIEAALEYNADFFERTTAERMVHNFCTLLEGIAANPDRHLLELPFISAEERRRIVTEFNQTRVDYPDTPVHVLFEGQAERTPFAPAAVFETLSLTYRELNARANLLAHHLITLNVAPGNLVGLSMERSLDMIVALLAILKAGGAYVPIDPEYPPERVRFMLENSGVALLLTQAHLQPILPPGVAKIISVDTDFSAAAAAHCPNPLLRVTPAGLAYMIYTSGSTGTPKGALNTHRGLTNRILWMQDAYRLGPDDAVLQKTPFSFDVSVWEFFWPLIAGARLVFAKPGGQRESDYLVDLIARERITTVHFVPSMLRAFLEEPDADRCTSLRRVICSGEALPTDLQARFFDRLSAELYNLYGPTEAAVDVTHWRCRRDDSSRVPIGRPISNTRIYILDEALEPTPVGVPGELCIGGVAVGAGYHRDPALTAAKFVPDRFSGEPEARLYRTGDRARFDEHGVIEFFGRMDHQVKIRGFRVEPGEIEAALRTHPSVTDCIVTARTAGAGTRLIAYVATSAPVEIPDLREFVRTRLPAHMVPSFFVTLESLPLLPNGKIDRKALPALANVVDVSSAQDPPRTEREMQLAAIWRDLLGLEEIGVHDNFFELGGDSILSIQVVARANQSGIRITAKQFFQNQTIAKLARAAGGGAVHAQKIDPLGTAPLTPVQRWFFEHDFDRPSHFNQSVLLQLPPGTQPGLLAAAVEHVYAHHDALRLRFERDDGGWSQRVAPPAPEDIFSVEPFERMPSSIAAAETSFDLANGPLIAVRLFTGAPENAFRLYLAIHHLAVDGVSWRILLEDLHSAYRQLSGGEDVQLPPKVTSFREWALRVQDYANSEVVAAETGFWLELLNREIPPLPVNRPHSRETNRVADTQVAVVALGEADTQALLREVPQAHETRINDVLLAALAMAFAECTGQRRLLVDLERHGRREFAEDLDLARTVGWFTTISPALLETPPAMSPGAVLKAVQEQLRRIPSEGFGYSLLRYSEAPALSNLSQAQLMFNYLGQLDQALPRTSGWGPAPERLGSDQAPEATRSHLLEVIAAVAGGELRVDFVYSRQVHDRGAIERLATAFIGHLQTLIRYCRAPHALVRELEERGRLVEDVYALSPMQEGLLFHQLFEFDPSAYFVQMSFAIRGEIDAAALRQSWADGVARHSVLRTAFFWRDLDHPVQIVLRNAEISWATPDWSSLSDEQREMALEQYMSGDRKRGFDFQKPPLLRCALAREGPARYRFCLGFHHIVLDGWSAAILVNEVIDDYLARIRSVTPAARTTAKPYRDYIEWLNRRDNARAESWWRGYLRGFEAPTQLPEKRVGGPAATGNECQQLWLPPDLTAALRNLVRNRRLTLNVLCRAAWGLVLSRYSGSDDIVFGVTVSGRPPMLEDIESRVGLFINTLPARLRIDHRQSFAAWLADLQAMQSEMEEYGFSSLADIQRWSEIPGGTALFDSLLVFENYPPAADRPELDISDLRSFDETTYPLTLTVIPEERLCFRLAYDPARFDSDTMRRMLGSIETLLRASLDGLDRKVENLPILTPTERRQVLLEFNQTDVSFDPRETVVHCLEEAAALHPDRIVVECDGRTLTARELNARANRLARWLLRQVDFEADDLVAVMARRSERMVEAILAIWKCGAAYVPIDPDYPETRIQTILERSRAKLTLTDSSLPPADLEIDSANLNRSVNPGSLAYVIFTSGSTGEPKGAMVEHQGMLNHLLAKVEDLKLGPASVVAQNASHCFDVSVWQFFAAPLAGGRTLILGDEVVKDAANFLGMVEASGVNVLELVPSYLTVLLERGAAALEGLNVLLVTGEALSRGLVDRWFRAFPAIPVINAYGPTEASDDITHHLMLQAPESGPVPVGRPIRNLRIYILDHQRNLCPLGVSGEVCVSGVGVGRGYLNDPQRTQEVFLEDPFREEPGVRMYRTGDIGCLQPDGTIVLAGRKDHQVKIRGHRIELGEIEHALEQLPGIDRAIVTVKSDPLSGDSLIAHLKVASLSDVESLCQSLARTLPQYMIPHAFSKIERFPLTANGKIDRKAIAAAGPAPARATRRVTPRNREEATLIEIWREVLGNRDIGVTDDYFDLGGHSILAVRLMARIEKHFQRRIPIAQLFRNPTIEKLAGTLASEAPPQPSNGLIEIRSGGAERPLFLVPGAGGNVIYFHALANSLREGRAIYGLEAPGLDGSTEPLSRVEDIAARNVSLLRSVTPGPYCLAGHSFGAQVALEMSRQLRQEGNGVSLLAIFDTSAPVPVSERYWENWDETEWLLAICHEIGAYLGVRLNVTRQNLEPLDPDAQLTCIIEEISRQGSWFADATPDRLRAYLNVYKSNFQAVYEPGVPQRVAPIVLFKASEEPAIGYSPAPEVAALRQDPSWGWQAFSSRPVATVDCGGTHLTMLLEPHAAQIAAVLDQHLEAIA